MGALHRFEGTFGRRRPEPDRDHRDHRRRLARRRPDVVRPGPVVGSAAAERVRAGLTRDRNLGPVRRAGLRESSRGHFSWAPGSYLSWTRSPPEWGGRHQIEHASLRLPGHHERCDMGRRVDRLRISPERYRHGDSVSTGPQSHRPFPRARRAVFPLSPGSPSGCQSVG